jgi:hypothetical protein
MKSLIGLVLIAAGVFAQGAKAPAPKPGPAKSPNALRLPDGQPNLTGYWSLSALRYGGNLATEGEAKVPYTEAGRKAFLEHDAKNDPTGFCQPPGWPRMAHSPFPMKIVQEKNAVIILYEYMRIWRQIDLNRKEHYPDVEDTFFGDSIGHWEGETLVIETTGLNDRHWLDTAGHQHTANMKVIERMTRTGPETVDYEIQVHDPEYYATPWIHKGTLKPQKSTPGLPELLEYFCTDNNIDIQHLTSLKPDPEKK